MTAEAIFDASTTKTQEVLFYVGRQRFQFCFDLLYVVNLVLLIVAILFWLHFLHWFTEVGLNNRKMGATYRLKIPTLLL
jgi:hypothetical protein